MCPMCAPAVQPGRACCRNLHVDHAMLAPDQIDAMPSQREGHGRRGHILISHPFKRRFAAGEPSAFVVESELVLTRDELQELLALGHERRFFEVKGPGSLSDKRYCAKVARALMAMGNLHDGGVVCLGLDETRLTDMVPGLDGSQLVQWSNFDDVSDSLARFSDPPVSFSLQPVRLISGADVVVLEVDEFEHVPHMCKRNYPDVLQDGMTYVRPRGKPESVPVPSSSEMRELLDLASTKGVREFVRRAGAAGIQLGSARSLDEIERESFADESVKAWADPSSVMEQIVGSGYTDVAVQPGPFDRNRLSPAQLELFVSEHAVRLRGWPVPYVDHRQPVQRYGAWIGQDVEPQVVPHIGAWRMCTSGQYLHRRVLATDLRDAQELAPSTPNATGAVAVWDVLLYLVELAEFGARMATVLDCERITFDVSLNGIAGRELISGDWLRELQGPYLVLADRLSGSEVVNSARLIASPRQIGVALAQVLLQQFGLDLPNQVLMDWQEQIFH